MKEKARIRYDGFDVVFTYCDKTKRIEGGTFGDREDNLSDLIRSLNEHRILFELDGEE